MITELQKVYVVSWTGIILFIVSVLIVIGIVFTTVPALIEHACRNALYIQNDYRQMKKSDMSVVEKVDAGGNVSRTLPHKNIALKRHALACL